MAAPVDADRVTTSFGSLSGSDPWSALIPASSAGDLLLIFYRGHGPATHVSTISGWTFLIDDNVADASDDVTNLAYRWATGSEGTSVSIDWTDVIKGAVIAHKITGAINPTTQAPEVTSAVGTGANVDCPNISPTGGSKEYLFIAYGGMDGETQSYTAPTNYTNLVTANSGTTGSDGANVRLAAASRQLTAASENPGAFTSGAPVSGWTGLTLAIHPITGVSFIPQTLVV